MTQPADRTSSPSGFARFAWGVFGYSILVILWGYFLRISESGDGCGTDWPLCHGAVVPAGHTFPTWVEFVHRISSGLVLLLVVILFAWALKGFVRRHPVRIGAGLALLFTVTESIFGAVLVIYGWVAGDISTARIVLRPLHVTNTFLLMAALAVTPFWASRGTPRIPSLGGPKARALWPAVVGTLVLAWTGSWTGLAATAFPAESVAEGLGQYLTGEHLLIYLRLTHPILAVFVVALIFWSAGRFRRLETDPVARTLVATVAGLGLLQLLVGPVTVLLMNPIWSRLLHLLLADLLWIGLILAWAGSGAAARSPASHSWMKETSGSSARTKAARS